MKKRLSTWGLVLAAALSASAWATPTSALVPAILTQQGRLLGTDGEPVSGEVQLVFTIYDDPTASAAANVLWTETHSVTLDEGYFSVRLGEDTDLPPDAFDGSVRYLGLKVGSDDEMTPRQSIASVPYALMANDVVGDIHPTSVTVDGNQVIDATGAWVGAVPFRPNSGLLSQVVGTSGTAAGASNRTATCPAGTSATGGGCNLIINVIGGSYLKASYPSVSGTRPNGWICRAQGVNGAGDSDAAAANVQAYAVCIAD